MISSHRSPKQFSALSLAALGVVFGDIGTSPLYAMREIFFSGNHPVPVLEANVFGILSTVVWTLILVVSIKYLAFIMRADNSGEGGIMALLALAHRTSAGHKGRQHLIMWAGILGACMFYADGMITPAISVLSAIEGLDVLSPSFSSSIVPITLTVLFLLFLFQSRGTAMVGALFGPIMALWFICIGALGAISVVQYPHILYALNPLYAVSFFVSDPLIAFLALGSVILAVTGAEALYADMGHFGRYPIVFGWFGLVFPALILSYFGQGALILNHTETAANPFYLLAPSWMLAPLIILATAATVIASQAVITGAMSMSRQALQLGYLPRVYIAHTSEIEEGQIYIPRINWLMMLAVMALVVGFESSSRLASAYGVAVTSNMFITTLLATLVFHYLWKWGWLRTLLLVVFFATIDLAFLSANMLKVLDGGWLPLGLSVVLFTVMLTWKTGRSVLYGKIRDFSKPIDEFLEDINTNPPIRIPGSAVFLSPNLNTTPHALLHNLHHNKVLHEKVVILTVQFLDFPHTAIRGRFAHNGVENRLEVKELKHNIYQVLIKYGFKDTPNIPSDLGRASNFGLYLIPEDTSFFVGKETLFMGKRSHKMANWRKKIFIYLFKSAEPISQQFKLPDDRVVELGTHVSF